MSGYIESGYIVVIGSLGVYAATLLRREQMARRRLGEHGSQAKTAVVDVARATDQSLIEHDDREAEKSGS